MNTYGSGGKATGSPSATETIISNTIDAYSAEHDAVYRKPVRELVKATKPTTGGSSGKPHNRGESQTKGAFKRIIATSKK
jgi:hypothetical protein